MNDGKIIKEDERQKITMHADATSHGAYIEHRIYDDKREIYKLLRRINHPNLARIFSVDFDGDTIVREELLEGVPLAELMENGVPLKTSAVKKIAKGVVCAMEALHNAGIIHRDIKPENILVGKNYHAWLIDFDIARIYRPQIKQDTDIRGTFGYAPLEQYGMMPTDFKTDIYAFGVTFFNLLSYAKIKGRMLKIAQKCKRLDPGLRYENSEKLRKELCKKNNLYPVMWGIVILTLTIAAFCFMGGNLDKDKNENSHREDYKIYIEERNDDYTDDKFKIHNADDEPQTLPENENQEEKNNPADSIKAEDFEENQYFALFPADDVYNKYSNYYNYSDAMVFGTNRECNHLPLFTECTKSGKIKLDNTIIDADITLEKGNLSVSLNDNKGNSFSHIFKPGLAASEIGGYTYRDFADLFCMDLTNDGKAELIVGVGSCYVDTSNGGFYASFSRSSGWCIEYDANKGFGLYDGMMHTKGRFGVEKEGVFLTASRGSDDEPYMFYIENGKLVGVDYGW